MGGRLNFRGDRREYVEKGEEGRLCNGAGFWLVENLSLLAGNLARKIHLLLTGYR